MCICMGASAAVSTRCVALQIFAIEYISLVCKGRGYPLPGEVITGRVAVNQVLQKPSGTGLPPDFPPVDDIRGKPHASMIMQIASFSQLAREAVHARQFGRALDDICGQLGKVIARSIACFIGFAVLPDAIAELHVEPLPVVAPCQFVDELGGLLGLIDSMQSIIAYLRQCKDTVAKIGGQPGHIAGQEVAVSLIDPRVYQSEGCFCRGSPSTYRAECDITGREMWKDRS